MNTDWQPFDPTEIKIDISQLTDAESRVAVEVPSPIVNKILTTNRKLGERAFGDEVLHKMLQKFCLENWMVKIDWRPMWQPVPVDDSVAPVLQNDHPFRFELDVDHHPEIVWPDFQSLDIVRPVRVVSDDLVAAEVREQCLALGTTENLESQFKVGDLIRAEVTLHAPNQSLVKAFKAEFVLLGSGKKLTLANLTFDGLFSALEKSVVGDEMVLMTTATSDFADAEFIGQEMQATIKILEAIRRTPIAIEAVLAEYGTPNEFVFKQQIRVALEATAERGQSQIIAEQVVNSVLEKVKDQLRIPDRVMQHFRNATFTRERERLEAKGCKAEQIDQELDSHRGAIDAMVLRHAHRQALINLLAFHLGARVGEQDLEDWVADKASKQGRRPEEVRAELGNPETLSSIVSILMTLKVTKILLKGDKIVLTDMDADEWNRQESAGGRQENGG